jgi:hypothetical protein
MHELSGEDIRRKGDTFFLTVPGLAGLELSADGGHVVLKGTLPSTRAQWLCVECCRHVPGVIAVVDLTSVDAIDTLIEVR